MDLPLATVKWKPSTFSIQIPSYLFRLQRVKASSITGFYHCTNVVYHCPNGQRYPNILGTDGWQMMLSTDTAANTTTYVQVFKYSQSRTLT